MPLSSARPCHAAFAATAVVGSVTIGVALPPEMLEAERVRLTKEIERLEKSRAGAKRKLSNPDFIGKAALRVFTEFDVEVHLSEFNAEEVREYLPMMASKYGLPNDLLELQFRLLPMHLHAEPDYADQLAAARTDLAARDPDDAHPLALARALDMPLWTNDRDLDGHGVECFSTARLLKVLGV